MSTPHTSFGSVAVHGPSGSLEPHWVSDRPESVVVDDIYVSRVDVRFGWSDSERPYCGKCRQSVRPVGAGDGTTVWVVDDRPHRRPVCWRTVDDTEISDEELVAHMWHEPDRRSVGSWCHGAAIHVDDESGTLKFIARTERHKVVVDLRQLPDGQVQVHTVRKRRRRKQKGAS